MSTITGSDKMKWEMEVQGHRWGMKSGRASPGLHHELMVLLRWI